MRLTSVAGVPLRLQIVAPLLVALDLSSWHQAPRLHSQLIVTPHLVLWQRALCACMAWQGGEDCSVAHSLD